MNSKFITILALLTLPFLLFAASCAHKEYIQTEGMVWNTTYHITYESSRDLNDSILAELKAVEMSVSAFTENSVVSRINRNETQKTDSTFQVVYNKALEINRLSEGAFDPTLAPLINAYGFGFKEEQMPDSLAVDSILQYVGIQKTRLVKGRLLKDNPLTEFNFSALAKGYGCDRVAEMFRRNGVVNFMIEIGGELALSGMNASGELWHISIDKPVFTNNQEVHDSQMVVSLSDCGMATSGNYRNFKEVDGQRIAHTIDPFTGRPAQTDILSATVIAPTCMEADALATACMSMGSVKAKAMLKRLPEVSVMFVLSDGTIYTSQNFPGE